MEFRTTHRYDAIVEDLLDKEKTLAHIKELDVSIGIMASQKEKKRGKTEP